MLKKILYIIVAILLAFLTFYISWNSSYSIAINNKGNKALEENNYEFFLKFTNYYNKDSFYDLNYNEDENTTNLKIYEAAEVYQDENKEMSIIPGYIFILTGINKEVIKIDEIDATTTSTDDDTPIDEVESTRIYIYGDNNIEYGFTSTTYGYDELPVLMFSAHFDGVIEKLTLDGSSVPTYIKKIKIIDSVGTVMFEADNLDKLVLSGHDSQEYWDTKSQGYTSKEYRENFVISFPEMWRPIIITFIVFIILGGIGVFIFWPKKEYAPVDTEDKSKYTYASKEEREKTAIERVAREKREKEERENRYKNVRKETTLEDITNEALANSVNPEKIDDAEVVENDANEVIENAEIVEESNTSVDSEVVENTEAVVESDTSVDSEDTTNSTEE